MTSWDPSTFLLAFCSTLLMLTLIEDSSTAESLKAGDGPLWIPDEFPNPTIDKRACRSHLNRLCDPDAVIEEEIDVLAIEDYLNRSRQFVPVCSKYNREDGPVEIQIGVAIVDRVSIFLLSNHCFPPGYRLSHPPSIFWSSDRCQRNRRA